MQSCHSTLSTVSTLHPCGLPPQLLCGPHPLQRPSQLPRGPSAHLQTILLPRGDCLASIVARAPLLWTLVTPRKTPEGSGAPAGLLQPTTITTMISNPTAISQSLWPCNGISCWFDTFTADLSDCWCTPNEILACIPFRQLAQAVR